CETIVGAAVFTVKFPPALEKFKIVDEVLASLILTIPVPPVLAVKLGALTERGVPAEPNDALLEPPTQNSPVALMTPAPEVVKVPLPSVLRKTLPQGVLPAPPPTLLEMAKAAPVPVLPKK